MSLRESVEAGLAALGPLDVRDQAAAELALRYADALDLCGEVDRGELAVDTVDASVFVARSLSTLGPKLLAALAALRMTPAARAANVRHTDDEDSPAVGDGDGSPVTAAPTSPLDALRRRRAERGAS